MINDYIALKEEREILHSPAFRRLKGKTQVFPYINQDLQVTERMSHSLEVGVNARLILNLFQFKYNNIFDINPIQLDNISKLHDIGHPPFGHAFERVANKLLKTDYIYFEGNAQNLRLIEEENLELSTRTIVSLIKYPNKFTMNKNKGLYSSQYKRYIPKLIEEIRKQYLVLKENKKSSPIGEDFLKLLKLPNKINLFEINNIKLIETLILEASDDITYLTHDLKDYVLYIKDKRLEIKIPKELENNQYILKLKNINKDNIDKKIKEIRDILITDLYFNFKSYEIKFKSKEIKELKDFLIKYAEDNYIKYSNEKINSMINLEKYLKFLINNVENKDFINSYIREEKMKNKINNTKSIKKKTKLLINYISLKTDKWLFKDYLNHLDLMKP